jgi:hypothetical protein
MASVEKRGNGWRARWRDPDGRSLTKQFVRKIDAEHHLIEVQHSILRGAYVDPRAGKTSLAEYANRWAADQAWRPSTRARVASILKRQILPAFGNRQVASLAEVRSRHGPERWLTAFSRRQSREPTDCWLPSSAPQYTID